MGLWDAAHESVTKLSSAVGHRKHKSVKAFCIGVQTALASLKSDVRNHVKRQSSLLVTNELCNLDETQDALFQETINDQCESLALDIYKPFKAAMAVMSQKILMVSLDGLQTLGAANYFGIRIHADAEEIQETESPASNLPEKGGSTLMMADIAVRDLLELVAVTDDATIHSQLIRTFRCMIVGCAKAGTMTVNPNPCHGQTLTSVIRFLIKQSSENRNPNIQKQAEECLKAFAETLVTRLPEAYKQALREEDTTPPNTGHRQSQTTPLSASMSERPSPTSATPDTKANARSPQSDTSPPVNTRLLSSVLRSSKSLVQLLSDAIDVIKYLTSVMSSVSGDSDDSNKATRISLEILQVLLNKQGLLIKHTFVFVDYLRSHLIKALIRTIITGPTRNSILALDLLAQLFSEFKRNLLAEKSFFIEHVVLRILAFPTSPNELRLRLLKSLSKFALEPSLIQRIFIHYDASLTRPPVAENLVHSLARIVHLGSLTDGVTQNSKESREFREEALQVLYRLIVGLCEWTHSHANGLSDSARGKKKVVSDVPGWITAELAKSLNPSTTDTPPSTCLLATTLNRRLAARRKLINHVQDFSSNPSTTLEHMWDEKILRREARHVADFFLDIELPLNKSAVGNWLGEANPFAAETLDEMLKSPPSFKGDDIDVALRRFLNLFRLPGEAQKIDRIIESFARAYCRDNPDFLSDIMEVATEPLIANGEGPSVVIQDAETKSECVKSDVPPIEDLAYIISFSVIMLHTDAHSREIRAENKMTMEEFVRNNRSCEGGEMLPVPFLSSLYERVVQQEWLLDDDLFNSAQSYAQKKRQSSFDQESRSIARKFEVHFSAEGKRRSPHPHERDNWREAEADIRSVLPYFMDQVTGSCRVAFLHRNSVSDLDESVKISLDGLLCLSRLSAILRLDVHKRECLASLALATGLVRVVPFQLPNAKHALALKKIISFVESNAEATDEAWSYVLIALSELERLGLIKSKYHLLKASLAAATGQGSLAGQPPQLAAFNGLLPPLWPDVPAIARFHDWNPFAECQPPATRRAETQHDLTSSQAMDAKPEPCSKSLLSSPQVPLRRLRDASRLRAGAHLAMSARLRWLGESSSLVSVNLVNTWTEVMKFVEVLYPLISDINIDAIHSLCYRLSHPQTKLFFLYLTQISGSEVQAYCRNQYNVSLTNAMTPVASRTSSLLYTRAYKSNDMSSVVDRPIRLNSMHRILDLVEGLMNRRSTEELTDLLETIIIPFFISVALHPDESVSLNGCDLLKQVAMSVLDSHRNLNQILFLEPFATVFVDASEVTKEFLIKITFNIVKTRGHLLTCGWAPILRVLCSSIPGAETVHQYDLRDTAQTTRERLFLAFKTLEHALNSYAPELLEHFSALCAAFVEYVIMFSPVTKPGDAAARNSANLHAALSNTGSLDDFEGEASLEQCSAQALNMLGSLARVVSGDEKFGDQARRGHTPNRLSTSLENAHRRPESTSASPEAWPCGKFPAVLSLGLCEKQDGTKDGADCFRSIQCLLRQSGRDRIDEGNPARRKYVQTFVWPLMESVAFAIQASSVSLDLRWKGIDILFTLLSSGGARLFNGDDWMLVFSLIIFPLFSSMLTRLTSTTSLIELDPWLRAQGWQGHPDFPYIQPLAESDEPIPATTGWAQKTSTLIFKSLMSLMVNTPSLAEDLVLHSTCLYIIGLFYTSAKENIARLGHEMFQSMLTICGKRLTSKQWHATVDLILLIWKGTQPEDLLESGGETPLDHSIIMSQSVLQLLLIENVANCLEDYINWMPLSCALKLLVRFEDSYSFASLFNSQVKRRRDLQLKGFMANLSSLPGLMKQERDSISHLLHHLFALVRVLGNSNANRDLNLLPFTSAMETDDQNTQPNERGDASILSAQSAKIHLQQLQTELTERDCLDLTLDHIRRRTIINDTSWTLLSFALIDVVKYQTQRYDVCLACNGEEVEVAVKAEAEREVSGLNRIFEETILAQMLTLPEPFFAQYTMEIYQLCSDWLILEPRNLRRTVRQILCKRLQPSLMK